SYSFSTPSLPSFPTRRSSDLGFDLFSHSRVHAFTEILFRDAQAQALDRLLKFRSVIRDWRSRGSRILRVAPGDDLQDGSDVFYEDRKSTRLNSSHGSISYAVF